MNHLTVCSDLWTRNQYSHIIIIITIASYGGNIILLECNKKINFCSCISVTRMVFRILGQPLLPLPHK